jgi:hypothetical protein
MAEKKEDGPPWKVGIVKMTPEMLRDALRNNYVNRPIIPKTVVRLRKDMREGRWQDPTVIWRNGGKLIDGQHRATAAIEENFALWCVVIDQVSTDIIDSIDGGTRRTDAQRLQMRAYDKSVSGLLGSLLGFLVNYKEHSTISSGNVSFPEKYEFLKQHDDVPAYATHWQGVNLHELPIKRALLAAVHWMTARVDKEKADEFFSLVPRVDLEDNSPALAFREFVGKIEDPTAPSAPRLMGTYLLQMWDKFNKGEEIKKRPAISPVVPTLSINW